MPSPSYFSILTADVRYDTGLSDFAKLLYSDITALCNKKGYCDATNDYFATQFGKSKRTISATVGALADAGYICIEVERDASNAVIARKIWVQANARAAAEKAAAQISVQPTETKPAAQPVQERKEEPAPVQEQPAVQQQPVPAWEEPPAAHDEVPAAEEPAPVAEEPAPVAEEPEEAAPVLPSVQEPEEEPCDEEEPEEEQEPQDMEGMITLRRNETLPYPEAYEALSSIEKSCVDDILAYAESKEGAKKVVNDKSASVYYGKKLLVRILLRRDKITARLTVQNNEFIAYTDKEGLNIKAKPVDVRVDTPETIEHIKNIINITYNDFYEERARREEEKREARREARRLKREAEKKAAEEAAAAQPSADRQAEAE